MTSRDKKRSNSAKGAGYLPFLRGPATKSEGDIGPDAYGMMSGGLQALYAARDAERDRMVAALLAGDEMPLPAPTAPSSRELH
jgi:hypothetical protein